MGRRRERVVGRPPARARGGLPVFVVASARPAFWREDSARFEGRDHVRIELRPLSRKQARSIASSILGDRASGDHGAALVDSIAQQSAGLPLFAEELARIAAAGRNAADAPTIEAAMQVHLDALDDFGRDAAAKLAIFGEAGWDVGLEAIGVPRAPEVLRELAAAEILDRAGPLALREHARVRVQARADARGGVRVAGRGAAAGIPPPRRPVAREGRRGRRDRRPAPRARGRRGRGRAVPREGGATGAGGACASGVGDARREGARVRGGQADAVRARAAPRRGVEPSGRARGRARHRRPRDARTPSTTRRARSAPRAPACDTKTPAEAAPTRARASTRCASRRRTPSSPTKRRGARRRWRPATRTGESSTRRRGWPTGS